MKSIKFKECNVEIAKDQEEYNTLYAYMDGEVTVSCYKLSFKERLKILFSGELWLGQANFGNPLQPQLPSVYKETFFQLNLCRETSK